MKNYVYLYFNDGTNQASSEEVAMAWGRWFDGLGDKIVDAGNPFNSGGKAVEKSGVTTIENWPATGYSIVKADSLDDAAEWAKDCPILTEPKGTVQVYEVMPM